RCRSAQGLLRWLYRRANLPQRASVPDLWRELNEHSIHDVRVFSALGARSLLCGFTVRLRTGGRRSYVPCCRLGAAKLRGTPPVVVQPVSRHFRTRCLVAIHQGPEGALASRRWTVWR